MRSCIEHFTGYRGWATVLLAFCLPTSEAPACAVPVFRYALERWEPDRFQVIVYHDGPLSANHAAALAKIDGQSIVHGGALPIELILDDLRSPTPPKLLNAERPSPDQPLPLVEVRALAGSNSAPEMRWTRCWRGPLVDAITEPGLFDSPARQSLIRRILEGDSAVWIVVAPDVEQGRAATAVLQESLATVAQSISMPQGIGAPGSELLASVPLVLRFSVLAIDRHDPAERQFLELLAASAKEWNSNSTYVIPVFGRGRALDVIPYADLDATLTQEIAEFLCGACSCQVKQANPGFDLLAAVRWEEELFGSSSPPIVNVSPNSPDIAMDQARTDPLHSASPEYVSIARGNDQSRTQATYSPRFAWSVLALGGSALLIAIVIGVRIRFGNP